LVDKRQCPELRQRKSKGRVDDLTWQPAERLELFLRALLPDRCDGRPNLSGNDRAARVVSNCQDLWIKIV
jgi:hypothetical protein